MRLAKCCQRFNETVAMCCQGVKESVAMCCQGVNETVAACCQGVKLRTRFGDPERTTGDSQESLESKQRGSSKRPSFMPTRSIASATRLINQHLFGIQTLEGTNARFVLVPTS
jgi:hypothetical protein